MTRRSIASVLLSAALAAPPAGAQSPAPVPAAPGTLTVDRIFRQSEFKSAVMPTVLWLKDGRSYVDLRANAGGGTDIVRVDLVTGAVTVLADAASLVDGAGKRIEVEAIELSPDERRALLFHSSVPVWRTNTRGVYHVVEFATRRVTPIATITTPGVTQGRERDTASGDAAMLGKRPSFIARGLQSGAADPALQMFAKFSPDGRQVAFVRANNLWATDLATGRDRQLTFDGSDDIINGTTDWVYEEELGLQDAFRWSPDSRRIAFYRFDQSEVPSFPIVNELDVYPRVSVLRYPKAGHPNSRVRVGVISASGVGDGPATRWLDVGGDTGNYVARMDWLDNDSLWVARMPRRQNQVDVLLLSAATGTGRTVLSDRDSAYVDVDDEGLRWIDGGRRLLWRSDRNGWRQLYLYERSGRLVRQVTRDGADVLSIAGYDSARGDVYVLAAAPNPTQRQLFRASLDGKRYDQVTRAAGTHKVTIGPGARYLVDEHASLGVPPTSALHELPSMRQLRVLQDNAALKQRVAALRVRAPEFIKVPTRGGVLLDAYRVAPVDFDSTRKYPVLIHVYGGPASPRVNDDWGSTSRSTQYLWHQMLAQQGYVVVLVDNRGAAWRGNAFRKATQLRLGELETEDALETARWLGTRSWADRERVGIWGWSYGGYLAAMASFRGGDLFRAAIAVAPVADWRLYDTIYTERFMWTPQGNPEGYRRAAPLSYVPGLRARFLMAHGTGDDNVHPQHTTQLMHALQEAGKPFYTMLYPNKTHSITGAAQQGHLYDTMTRFLDEHLKSGPAPRVMQ